MIFAEGSDFVVREVDFPRGVHGALMADEDGRGNIYIRHRDTDEEKLRTFHHEMKHLILGHPWSDKTTEEKEKEVEK